MFFTEVGSITTTFYSMKKSMGPIPELPEEEVFMTEIMRKESNLNNAESRNDVDVLPEFLIAIDHGWSSIKTPNIIFENSITELQTMPATKDTLYPA